MTSISAFSTSTSAGTAVWAAAMRPREDPFAKVASVLSLSGDDLRSRLAGGRSLNDVADTQGVSRGTLLATIKSSLPSGAPDTDQAAESIAGSTRGINAGLRDEDKPARVGNLLDMDTEDLTNAVTSAPGLAGMLQDKGLGVHHLRRVLESGDLLDVRA